MGDLNLSKLEKDKFISLNKEQFIECVYHFNPSKLFLDQYNSIAWNMFYKSLEFQIYIGDIYAEKPLFIENSNLLVIGDIKTPWLSNATEGGALIVIGNIECDYYNHCWDKIGLISGNLTANRLLINAFSDSGLFVLGNVKTEFFYGEDIWISVGGNVELEYGIGYCLALDYKTSKKIFKPKYDKEKSYKYLKIDKNSTDFEVHNVIHVASQNFTSHIPIEKADNKKTD
ncbi:MAG: hypothetical protein K8R54_07530 [Bacteroidales bacterium]|nr:hypothetical protein [Bacteroidales bacterium]